MSLISYEVVERQGDAGIAGEGFISDGRASCPPWDRLHVFARDQYDEDISIGQQIRSINQISCIGWDFVDSGNGGGRASGIAVGVGEGESEAAVAGEGAGCAEYFTQTTLARTEACIGDGDSAFIEGDGCCHVSARRGGRAVSDTSGDRSSVDS